jgi:hypothetical protein
MRPLKGPMPLTMADECVWSIDGTMIGVVRLKCLKLNFSLCFFLQHKPHVTILVLNQVFQNEKVGTICLS